MLHITVLNRYIYYIPSLIHYVHHTTAHFTIAQHLNASSMGDIPSLLGSSNSPIRQWLASKALCC